jgi:hypothetical protein
MFLLSFHSFPLSRAAEEKGETWRMRGLSSRESERIKPIHIHHAILGVTIFITHIQNWNPL